MAGCHQYHAVTRTSSIFPPGLRKVVQVGVSVLAFGKTFDRNLGLGLLLVGAALGWIHYLQGAESARPGTAAAAAAMV